MNKEFIINDGCLEKYIGEGGDVIIPDEVEEIAPNAFEHCVSLVSVFIPNNVYRIGEYAFSETELTNANFAACI